MVFVAALSFGCRRSFRKTFVLVLSGLQPLRRLPHVFGMVRSIASCFRRDEHSVLRPEHAMGVGPQLEPLTPAVFSARVVLDARDRSQAQA
ncbi:hypothetical protein D9M68_911790 [compost metagenome]